MKRKLLTGRQTTKMVSSSKSSFRLSRRQALGSVIVGGLSLGAGGCSDELQSIEGHQASSFTAPPMPQSLLVNRERAAQIMKSANLDAIVCNGSSTTGVQSKRSQGYLWFFVEVDDHVEFPMLTALSPEIDRRKFKVRQLGKKRAQQFRSQISKNLPSYIIASLPVIQCRNDESNFAMPQLGFWNLDCKSELKSSVPSEFGHMREEEPSKHIFEVVSDQDLLT